MMVLLGGAARPLEARLVGTPPHSPHVRKPAGTCTFPEVGAHESPEAAGPGSA